MSQGVTGTPVFSFSLSFSSSSSYCRLVGFDKTNTLFIGSLSDSLNYQSGTFSLSLLLLALLDANSQDQKWGDDSDHLESHRLPMALSNFKLLKKW